MSSNSIPNGGGAGGPPPSGRPVPTTRIRSSVHAEPEEHKEIQNARALQVLARVKEKLTGRDFKREQELDVPFQVEKLLTQATNLEGLCVHYGGWCAFW